MNCKPGELAMLVHPELMQNPECFFDNPVKVLPVKIVRVVRLMGNPADELWALEEPIVIERKCIHGEQFKFGVAVLSDKNLRPIRDPGDAVQTDNPVKLMEPA